MRFHLNPFSDAIFVLIVLGPQIGLLGQRVRKWDFVETHPRLKKTPLFTACGAVVRVFFRVLDPKLFHCRSSVDGAICRGGMVLCEHYTSEVPW